MGDNIEDVVKDVREKVGDSVEYVQDKAYEVANGTPRQSDFSKAAGEAIEYIQDMLEQGADLAVKAFNGAVEMGKDAYEYISHNAPGGNGKGGPDGPAK